MSRKDLENRDLEKLAPPDRLLFLLKTRGPQTAADLSTRLQITPEAVRQQARRHWEKLVGDKTGYAVFRQELARSHGDLARHLYRGDESDKAMESKSAK